MSDSILTLLQQKREELVARQNGVIQQVQEGERQVIALAGAIAAVDEMLVAAAAQEEAPQEAVE